jgi:hypothetical protein
MMSHEFELKLQAYLDGEMPARDAEEVEASLAQDQEGRALLAELRNTASAMAVGEEPLKLPESREFYWSKIAREIERHEKPVAAPARKISWLAWVHGHLLPVSGVALVLGVIGIMLMRSHAVGGPFGEMELASDDMGAYTFRDQQQKMTMVWFYDRNADSEVADPATMASMDEE